MFSGGGCPSISGRFGSKHAYFGADLAQMIPVGGARSGLSSVPARMKVTAGRSSASLKAGVPHFSRSGDPPLPASQWPAKVVVAERAAPY
jgi:hypothetical protein